MQAAGRGKYGEGHTAPGALPQAQPSRKRMYAVYLLTDVQQSVGPSLQVTHVVSQSDVVKLLWANKAVLGEGLARTVSDLELDDVSGGGSYCFSEDTLDSYVLHSEHSSTEANQIRTSYLAARGQRGFCRQSALPDIPCK